ncbi:MAG: hypothetical protein PVI41_09855, partial [Roseobacter sp.]
MEFISLTWFAWMWGTVTLYWLVPHSARSVVLIGVSALFLLSVSPLSLVLLCGFTLICHFAGNRPAIPARLLGMAVGIMVLTLFWFKLGITADSQTLMETVLIPLGLSYYTFRCIHFLMERFTGRIRACTFRELVAYLFFLPTFVVGPIHRADDFLKDMRRQRFDTALLSEGAERILYGYV